MNNYLVGQSSQINGDLPKIDNANSFFNSDLSNQAIALTQFNVGNILTTIEEVFSFSEKKSEENVEVVFTKDKDLLDQYYKLRERCYRNDTGWREYDGSESATDRRSMIVVAKNSAGTVIGGARFLIPGSSEYTSNEIPDEGYTIRNALEKSGLNVQAKYSEISAVAIDKAYRNRESMKKMFCLMIDESIKNGCDYIVGFAIWVASRDHKIAFRSLGYKLDVLKDFPWLKQKNHGYEQRFPLVAYLK